MLVLLATTAGGHKATSFKAAILEIIVYYSW